MSSGLEPDGPARASQLKCHTSSDASDASGTGSQDNFEEATLVICRANEYANDMFSHIVIFWTNPDQPNAADTLIAGAKQHLKPIPGVLLFHVGRMVTDGRPVVESSYQVALTTVFASREARKQYRGHPGHERFKQEVYTPNCARCLIYDFE